MLETLHRRGPSHATETLACVNRPVVLQPRQVSCSSTHKPSGNPSPLLHIPVPRQSSHKTFKQWSNVLVGN